MKYKPEFAEIAATHAANGATGRMLAAILDVCEDTISRWRRQHPEFGRAMEKATALADHTVEQSLYDQAVGYTVETREAVRFKKADGGEGVKVVTVTKHHPAKTAATLFWLRNRQPELWREKTELSLSGGGLDAILADVMNKSRGLPSEHPTAQKYMREYGKRGH